MATERRGCAWSQLLYKQINGVNVLASNYSFYAPVGGLVDADFGVY